MHYITFSLIRILVYIIIKLLFFFQPELEEVIPKDFGGGNLIILERCAFNKDRMSQWLDQSVGQQMNVNKVLHGRMYAVEHGGRLTRAMVKFTDQYTAKPMLALLDELGPLICFNPGLNIKVIQDERLKTEKYGLVKLKLYDHERFNFYTKRCYSSMDL